MQLTFGLEGLRHLPPGAALAIGNFDGMHLGHRRIIQTLLQLAAGSLPTAVVTFEPHPLTVLRPAMAPPRLTTAAVKRELLAATGVSHIVEIAPEWPVLNLQAEEFWELLREEVRPAHIVEGRTFTFGKGRRGTVQRLRQWAQGTDVAVHEATPAEVALLDMHLVPASSSLIRGCGGGRVRDAAICLGRAYALRGVVVRGHGRGRGIGVPTANLACSSQLVPGDGVYAGRCRVGGAIYPAAVSIGVMPTFGTNQRQIEAHVIGFDGDVYGQELEVELLDWLRDQRSFAGVEALQGQLGRDIRRASCAVAEPSRL